MESIQRVRTSFVYRDVDGNDALTVRMGMHSDTVRISMEAPPFTGGATAHLDVNQVRMLAARLTALAEEMEEYF